MSKNSLYSLTKPVYDFDVYDSVLVDGKTAAIKFVFKFDGRMKNGQCARGTYFIETENADFMVEVVKKSGPVYRQMKACAQRDMIKKELVKLAQKSLMWPGKGTDREQSGEQTENKKENKGRVASGDELDRKLREAHDNSNRLIAKAVNKDPVLKEMATVNPVSMGTKVSDDPLEIPEFLKRA